MDEVIIFLLIMFVFLAPSTHDVKKEIILNKGFCLESKEAKTCYDVKEISHETK